MTTNKEIPSLVEAAKEFNMSLEVLLKHLHGWDFEINESSGSGLTEKAYKMLEAHFASDLAERRIRECIETKNTRLDIGNCGLTDNDFTESSRLPGLLKLCGHVETLTLSTSWRDHEQYKSIESENKKEENHLSFLPFAISFLTSLKKLICRGNPPEKFSINEMELPPSLKSLTYLDLSNNQISEINDLDSLAALTILDLSGNQIKEIRGLDSLGTLNELDLSRNQITEIKGLNSLTALTLLNLSFNQITEIKGLDSFTSLTRLNLAANQITEIKGLNSLIVLKRLDLGINQITEIKDLDSLASLTELNLSNNQIIEIKDLDSLTSLTVLDLLNNQISEIKGLNLLNSLVYLYLSDNQISEIKGLNSLNSLTHLYLSDNQISEIKGLNSLNALTNLYLSNNQITEIKSLKFIPDNPALFLSISNNPFLTKYQITLNPNENHYPFIKELLTREQSQVKQIFTYPLKVLLLGNHAAGKSSLVNYLTKEQTEGSTHILRIKNYWRPGSPKNTNIPDVIFYDFGGQDFYHGIYQAFISAGALQIIVFDIREQYSGKNLSSQPAEVQALLINAFYFFATQV